MPVVRIRDAEVRTRTLKRLPRVPPAGSLAAPGSTVQRATTSAFVAPSLRRAAGERPAVVFGVRSDWGGIVTLHVAPASASDVIAAFTSANVTTDLWEIGPKRAPALAVALTSLTRRRAFEVVHREPSGDLCLVADPSTALTGDLGVSLSADRHVTFYSPDRERLGAVLATLLSRRLALSSPLPSHRVADLVVPTTDTWLEARSEETERLQVLRLRDVDSGEETERFVRSRTIDWRAGFSW